MPERRWLAADAAVALTVIATARAVVGALAIFACAVIAGADGGAGIAIAVLARAVVALADSAAATIVGLANSGCQRAATPGIARSRNQPGGRRQTDCHHHTQNQTHKLLRANAAWRTFESRQTSSARPRGARRAQTFRVLRGTDESPGMHVGSRSEMWINYSRRREVRGLVEHHDR